MEAYTYDELTNTYTVYTAEGLLAWNTAVQSDLSLNITLAADIDLTNIDYDWTLVGNSTSSNQYTGTFEGGGHIITGLTVNQSSTEYVGLIGCLGSGGVVQNLKLENVSITGDSYAGGIAGYNNGTITECYITGSVSGFSFVGGVAGYNYGTITACYSTGSVSGNSNNVGGIVGNNSGSNAKITACYSTGNVSGTSYVGGVVGSNRGTITACYYSNADKGVGSAEKDTEGETDKVGGSETTWTDAVSGMNSALETNQSDWRYEILTGNTLPTLKKSE